MDIRGVLGNRLAKDRVDQTDDRRVVLLLQQVLGFLDLPKLLLLLLLLL